MSKVDSLTIWEKVEGSNVAKVTSTLSPLGGRNSANRLPLDSKIATLFLSLQPASLSHQVLDLPRLHNFMSQFLKINLSIYTHPVGSVSLENPDTVRAPEDQWSPLSAVCFLQTQSSSGFLVAVSSSPPTALQAPNLPPP